MKTLKITYAFALCLFASQLFAQNDINQSKEKLKTPTEQEDYPSQEKPEYQGDGIQSKEGSLKIFQLFPLVIKGTRLLFFGSYKNENALSNNRLTPHPFKDYRMNGNYLTPELVDSIPKKVRFELNNQLFFNPQNVGNRLRMKLRLGPFLSLQASHHELLNRSEFESGIIEGLRYFNFEIGYDRVRLKKFNMGWTMGWKQIFSGINTSAFIFGMNAEYFLPLDLSIYGATTWSGINGHDFFESELELHYFISRFFLSLGYERIKISDDIYKFTSAGIGIYL